MESRILLMNFLSRLPSTRQISQNPGTLGKRHQLREGLDLHLLHHPVAMRLDRALGRTQYDGNLLVGLAANNELEDLPLARRQLRNMGAHDVELVSLSTRYLVVSHGPFNCSKKLFRRYRLGEYIFLACLDGPHGSRDVRIASEKHDREGRADFAQTA